MKTGKILLLIILILGIISCNTDQKKAPMAKQGILDLGNWDFEKDGNVRLDGDWEFYWNEFLTSKDFDTVQQKHYIKVPKPWNDYKWGNQELGYEGYATYRLRILVNDKIKDFGLKFPDQGTAFELYLNDSLVGKNGKIGKTKETMQPQYKPLLIAFQNNKDTIDIVCRVSNFHFHFGGLYFNPEFGKQENIIKLRELYIIRDFILSGVLLILSFILFNFFIFRPKEKASLYFALFCFCTIIRTMSTGEKIICYLFQYINWELLIKLESIWIFASPLLTIYFYSLFKNEMSLKVIFGISTPCLIFSIVNIFFKASFNSLLIPLEQIAALSLTFYCYYSVFKAIFKKREGSLMILFGYSCFIFGGINEVLFYNMILPLYIPLPLGMFIFALSQTTLLSRRFSKAFNRVENFANELKIEVEEKTRDLRTEKDKSEKLLLNVLPEQIANRLKEGETPIADHFEEASVIFIDIADFTKLSAKSSPQMMVKMLNEIFTIFDKIAAKYGLEKIKTIGDCYMAAAGIPVPRKDHAEAIAMMALDVMSTMKEYRSEEGHEIKFRIGLDCGPIVAGVIGEQKFIYDLWGDMVNTASRMETNGIIGKIQVTERFKNALTLPSPSGRGTQGEDFKFIERGEIEIKGKGKMKTWFLIDN